MQIQSVSKCSSAVLHDDKSLREILNHMGVYNLKPKDIKIIDYNKYAWSPITAGLNIKGNDIVSTNRSSEVILAMKQLDGVNGQYLAKKEYDEGVYYLYIIAADTVANVCNKKSCEKENTGYVASVFGSPLLARMPSVEKNGNHYKHILYVTVCADRYIQTKNCRNSRYGIVSGICSYYEKSSDRWNTYENICVIDVMEKGAAFKNGVKKWDVIMSVNGSKVESLSDACRNKNEDVHGIVFLREGMEYEIVIPDVQVK